jgi:hypothetical protein
MRWARAVAALCLAVALCGCESREEAKTRNEHLLPSGCKIIDMDYGDLTAAVVCDGRKTTTSVKSWDETIPMTVSDGKTTMVVNQIYHHAAITAQIDAPSSPRGGWR